MNNFTHVDYRGTTPHGLENERRRKEEQQILLFLQNDFEDSEIKIFCRAARNAKNLSLKVQH